MIKNILKKMYRIFGRGINIIEFLVNFIVIKIMKCEIDISTIKNITGKIYLRNNGIIKIGKNVKINSKYSSNPIGGQEFTTIITGNSNSRLIICDCSGISNSTIICWNSIYIGKDVFIGGDCKIYDTDFHSILYEERCAVKDNGIKTEPIYIDDGVFIGTGCIILKGANIGKKSVVAAGSVVTKSIPPNELWGGNPAKFIKKIY